MIGEYGIAALICNDRDTLHQSGAARLFYQQVGKILDAEPKAVPPIIAEATV